jgi:hypothetical protein
LPDGVRLKRNAAKCNEMASDWTTLWQCPVFHREAHRSANFVEPFHFVSRYQNEVPFDGERGNPQVVLINLQLRTGRSIETPLRMIFLHAQRWMNLEHLRLEFTVVHSRASCDRNHLRAGELYVDKPLAVLAPLMIGRMCEMVPKRDLTERDCGNPNMIGTGQPVYFRHHMGVLSEEMADHACVEQIAVNHGLLLIVDSRGLLQ